MAIAIKIYFLARFAGDRLERGVHPNIEKISGSVSIFLALRIYKNGMHPE